MRSPSLSSYPWTQTRELGVSGYLAVHSVISIIFDQPTHLLYVLSLHPAAEFLKKALHELPATYALIS